MPPLTMYTMLRQNGRNYRLALKPEQAKRLQLTSVIPLGSKVYIPELGVYLQQKIQEEKKGNRIDIYMDNHEEAAEFEFKETTGLSS